MITLEIKRTRRKDIRRQRTSCRPVHRLVIDDFNTVQQNGKMAVTQGHIQRLPFAGRFFGIDQPREEEGDDGERDRDQDPEGAEEQEERGCYENRWMREGMLIQALPPSKSHLGGPAAQFWLLAPAIIRLDVLRVNCL